MPLYYGNLMSGWSSKRKKIRKNKNNVSSAKQKTKTVVKEVPVLDRTKRDVKRTNKTVDNIVKSEKKLAKTKISEKNKNKSVPEEYEEMLFKKFKKMGL